MFDVMSYADRNDVEVSIRKGHDGRTVWEIFLRELLILRSEVEWIRMHILNLDANN